MQYHLAADGAIHQLLVKRITENVIGPISYLCYLVSEVSFQCVFKHRQLGFLLKIIWSHQSWGECISSVISLDVF